MKGEAGELRILAHISAQARAWGWRGCCGSRKSTEGGGGREGWRGAGCPPRCAGAASLPPTACVRTPRAPRRSMQIAFELGGDFHSRTAFGMYDHIQKDIAAGACARVPRRAGRWQARELAGRGWTAPMVTCLLLCSCCALFLCGSRN